MSAARRRDVAAVVRRHGLHVIEDDVHGLLEPDHLAPLASLVPERTLYIASTSKVVAGGLRVAFVAAPEDLVERLGFAVAASLWALPAINLELAAVWIEDGTAAAVTDRKREEAAARQELARRILSEGRFQETAQSYFLWLELPEPWQSDHFVRAARERGVAVAPAGAFAGRQDRAAAGGAREPEFAAIASRAGDGLADPGRRADPGARAPDGHRVIPPSTRIDGPQRRSCRSARSGTAGARA